MDGGKFPEQVAVSVITYAALRAGVLAARDLSTRDRRLGTLALLADYAVVPIDDAVADAWALLRLRLREAGANMKVNDSWIAATALALGVPVLTQVHDFDGVPGLETILV